MNVFNTIEGLGHFGKRDCFDSECKSRADDKITRRRNVSLAQATR